MSFDVDDQIELIASAHDDTERDRWATWEAFSLVVDIAPTRQERGEIVRRIGRRIGKSSRLCQTWLRAVRIVPAELRLAFVPIGTILWATQNLAWEECAVWLERVHDEGLTLRQLQVLVGKAEEVNANTPTLRRILRSIAKDMPDEPMNPELAGVLEAMLLAALEPYINETKPPATEVTEG